MSKTRLQLAKRHSLPEDEREVLAALEVNIEHRYPEGNERWWWQSWSGNRLCQRVHPEKNHRKGGCVECLERMDAALAVLDEANRA